MLSRDYIVDTMFEDDNDLTDDDNSEIIKETHLEEKK
jgi:hypothetical protein